MGVLSFLPEFTAAAVLTNFELFIRPLISDRKSQDVGGQFRVDRLIDTEHCLITLVQTGWTYSSVEEEQETRHS